MKQLIVAKQNLYASGVTGAGAQTSYVAFGNDSTASTAIPALASGALAFVAKDSSAATCDKIMEISHTTAPTSSTLDRYFQLYWNSGKGIMHTPIIDKTKCTITKQAYTAPVAKVMTLATLINSVTVVASDTVGITVTSKDVNTFGKRPYEKTYWCTNVLAGQTGANLAANLVAVINADADRLVTASTTSGDNLVLTSRVAGRDFHAGRCGLALTANPGTSFAVTTANVIGTGTVAHIQALEKSAIARDMSQNVNAVVGATPYTVTSQIDTTKTYDLYTLLYEITDSRGMGYDGRKWGEVVIAVDSALTAAANYNIMQTMTNLVACLTTVDRDSTPIN